MVKGNLKSLKDRLRGNQYARALIENFATLKSQIDSQAQFEVGGLSCYYDITDVECTGFVSDK